MIKVADIRTQKIGESPIIYKWWFKKDAAMKLIKPILDELDENRLQRRAFLKEEYILLYVGQGKNGQNRLIDYHILDKSNFHAKGIQNKRLSSLRQTLCGLLGCNMSAGKNIVDEFIDKNGAVEYESCSIETLIEVEKDIIAQNYPPLNYQNTMMIFSKKHRKVLSELKKQYRL